jgi:hypothetical protein
MTGIKMTEFLVGASGSGFMSTQKKYQRIDRNAYEGIKQGLQERGLGSSPGNSGAQKLPESECGTVILRDISP